MPALEYDKMIVVTMIVPANQPPYRTYLFLLDNKSMRKGNPAQRQEAKPAGLSKLPVTL